MVGQTFDLSTNTLDRTSQNQDDGGAIYGPASQNCSGDTPRFIVPSLLTAEITSGEKSTMKMIAIAVVVAAAAYIGYKMLVPSTESTVTSLPMPLLNMSPMPMEGGTSPAMAQMVANAAGATSNGIANMFV